MPQKTRLLYEGKAKKIWETDDPDLLISEFKDSLTAFNGEKKSEEAGKGGGRPACAEVEEILLQREGAFPEADDPAHGREEPAVPLQAWEQLDREGVVQRAEDYIAMRSASFVSSAPCSTASV